MNLGRYPRAEHITILPVYWHSPPPPLDHYTESLLPFGQGRSYGDTCLNEGGIVIDTAPLSQLHCESEVTLAETLELIVPKGRFLAITPGTKHVSV